MRTQSAAAAFCWWALNPGCVDVAGSRARPSSSQKGASNPCTGALAPWKRPQTLNPFFASGARVGSRLARAPRNQQRRRRPPRPRAAAACCCACARVRATHTDTHASASARGSGCWSVPGPRRLCLQTKKTCAADLTKKTQSSEGTKKETLLALGPVRAAAASRRRRPPRPSPPLFSSPEDRHDRGLHVAAVLGEHVERRRARQLEGVGVCVV